MMPVTTASAIAFVTGMGALVGFVGMMADKHTQMVAFVGVAVADEERASAAFGPRGADE